jgi:trans-aconitate 2-methyltransferase
VAIKDGKTLAVPYTFGDLPAEAYRLGLLHELFEPSSRQLLMAAVPGTPSLAYDLGCGPGHTTRMVAKVTGAVEVVGLERSSVLLARDCNRAQDHVRFAVWDVTQVPFPAGVADLIYARLLLAHLVAPLTMARLWADQLAPGGTLVLDEIEWVETSHPVLRAHLDLATARVRTTGAIMCAGPELEALGRDDGLRRRVYRVDEVQVPTAKAAAMFATSLAGWGQQAVDDGLCRREELQELVDALDVLRLSPASGEISWGLRQASYEASPG